MPIEVGTLVDADLLNGMTRQVGGFTAISSDSSTWASSTEVLAATATANLTAGQLYEIRFYASIQATVTGSLCLLRIREDNTTGTQISTNQCIVNDTTSVGFGFSLMAQHTAVSTASKTFVVTGARISGTATLKIAAAASRQGYLQIWQVFS